MAELRLKILGDLKQLKIDIQKLLKEKFKIGIEGKGEVGESKGEKKQSGLLLGILGKVAPIVLIFNTLRKVFNLFELIEGFLVLGLLKIFQFLKFIDEGIKNVREKIKEWLKVGWEFLKALPKRIWEFLKALPGKIWNFVKNLAILIWEKLKEGFFKIVDWIKTAVDWIKNLAKLIWDKIKIGFKWLVDRGKLLLANFKIKMKELKDKLKEKLELLKTKIIELKDKLKEILIKIRDFIKELPQKIWDKIKELAGLIADKLRELFPFLKKTKVTDAIIKPSGQVIETDPRDTIIATKNPEGLGGGNKTFIFNGVTPQQMIDVIKRELGVDVFRSSRF